MKKIVDQKLGVEITVENLTTIILRCKDDWEEIRKYVRKVLQLKENSTP